MHILELWSTGLGTRNAGRQARAGPLRCPFEGLSLESDCSYFPPQHRVTWRCSNDVPWERAPTDTPVAVPPALLGGHFACFIFFRTGQPCVISVVRL